MASEPAPRQDELAEKLLAAVIAADTAEYQPEGEDSDENWWRYIIAKAVLPTVSGLLADPAQTTELEQLRAHVSDCHRFQNNVAHILGVETDWDEAGRKAVEHAAIRAVGNLAEARRDIEAMKPRTNGVARQLADLRDELATAREETAAARDLAEMRAEDRTETDTKLEVALAERDDRQARIEALETKIAGLADELERRGHQRDEIGDDDPSEDDTCAEEGLDCHTVSAVATWFRAARIVRAALAGDQPSGPGQDATLGPRHPAGSPEGHFPTDPQMPGSVDQGTPPDDQPMAEEPICGATNDANPNVIRTCTQLPHPDDEIHMDHWTTWWGDSRTRDVGVRDDTSEGDHDA